jgi:SNF2 family DNA or RNA helicase
VGSCTGTLRHSEVRLPAPAIQSIALANPLDAERDPSFERALQVGVRPFRILQSPPWVRSLGKLALEVGTEGWRFPVPRDAVNAGAVREGQRVAAAVSQARPFPGASAGAKKRTRLRPPADAVVLKERLLYLLQPPLENLFAGKQVRLPLQPYPYQVEGIAFLMPRHAALLADEMGLGKTVQSILALRLLFQAGLIQRALLVCPKPLVHNWGRELRIWAEDLPFEIISGDAQARRSGWLVSNCPLKLVNYELLTRDADYLADERLRFDVVILDEAQRIKNRESKTSRAARSIQRSRSWALTGTPVENRSEDLINLFAFVDPDRIPADTPPKNLPQLTADCILRRTKEEVLDDLPARTVRDACLELTPPQRAAYALAESEGVVRLNALGDTITVQHVFELVLRLKQICNFDPLTRASAKLEQLQADLAEVADSGRKAIIFSQWVEPLRYLASALAEFRPLEFHGQVPIRERQRILERFEKDRTRHVILMSYGTGSVGLNLQCANYVFLFDRWWNPAVEDQAINRVHRIGQKEPVFVTRFTTQGTIEERIAEVLEKKRQLFSELIDQNEAPRSLGLTEEEIFGLFNIQARPRRTADVSAA